MENFGLPFWNFRLLAALCVAAPASLAAPRPVLAQTPTVGFTPSAYGVTDNASDTGAAGYSLGFEFTADSPVFVTALGYFSDPSFNSGAPFGTVSLSPEPAGSYTYASTHQVGLYQVVPGVGSAPETGLLLASATVTAAGTPSGDFLYAPLALAVPLLPGAQYVLAGTTGGTDPFLFNIEDDSVQPGGMGLTTSSAITYDQDQYTVSSTLAFPGSTDPGAEPGFFGPNLLTANTAPVPEASTIVSLGLLLALGLGSRALSRRRTRAQSAS